MTSQHASRKSSLSAFLVVVSGLVSLGARAEDPGDDPPALPPIVFAARERIDVTAPPGESTAVVRRADRGRLLVREPDGSIRTLVDAQAAAAAGGVPADVSDPDVSYDAERIVFAGYSREESAWRIYEVRADGTGLRQVTHGDPDRHTLLEPLGALAGELAHFDDVDPCYLPDGRICFVSTRYPEVAPDGRRRATNLYIVDADGSGLERITSERFGGETPAVHPITGEIVYSRWWRSPPLLGDEPPPPSPPYYHPDNTPARSANLLRGLPDENFTGLNLWFLASIRPDGEDLAMFSGLGLDRTGTQAYRPSFLPGGEALALQLSSVPILGRPGTFAVRIHGQGAGRPEVLTARGERRNPTLSSAAVAIGEGLLAMSGIDPTLRANEAADHDLRFYSIGPGGALDLLLEFGEPDVHELDPVLLVARDRPPVLARTDGALRLDDRVLADPARAAETHGVFRFQCENIFANPPVDSPLPESIPIGKMLFIEFYMNPQRTDPDARDEPILLERQRIDATGKVEAELPAGVPLFEVIRLADGRIAQGRSGQIYHVGGHNFAAAGSTTRCVGCHSGHTQLEIPAEPEYTNLAPSAILSASGLLRGGEPHRAVDRQTSTAWGPRSGAGATLALRWGIPIEARDVVLHAGATSFEEFTVTTYRGDAVGDRREYRLPVVAEGTSLGFRSSSPFDRLELTLHPTGAGEEEAAAPRLAEIEVIGRGVAGSTPGTYFVRSDATCDGQLNVTDAVALLNGLFLGATLCCEQAADADADGTLNLTDALRILNYLYLFGPAFPEPFPNCGRVEQAADGSGLSCDQEQCR